MLGADQAVRVIVHVTDDPRPPRQTGRGARTSKNLLELDHVGQTHRDTKPSAGRDRSAWGPVSEPSASWLTAIPFVSVTH